VSRTRNSFHKDASPTIEVSQQYNKDIERKCSLNATSPGLKRACQRETKETLPPRTIDEAQEDEIIRLLEIHQRKRLEEDPMRELDEALMDRTTASLNRRQKVTSIWASTVFIEENLCNSSGFVIRNVESAAQIKQQAANLYDDMTESEFSSDH
jgi:hypothetical protein